MTRFGSQRHRKKTCFEQPRAHPQEDSRINTLRTGDADLRF